MENHGGAGDQMVGITVNVRCKLRAFMLLVFLVAVPATALLPPLISPLTTDTPPGASFISTLPAGVTLNITQPDFAFADIRSYNVLVRPAQYSVSNLSGYVGSRLVADFGGVPACAAMINPAARSGWVRMRTYYQVNKTWCFQFHQSIRGTAPFIYYDAPLIGSWSATMKVDIYPLSHPPAQPAKAAPFQTYFGVYEKSSVASNITAPAGVSFVVDSGRATIQCSVNNSASTWTSTCSPEVSSHVLGQLC